MPDWKISRHCTHVETATSFFVKIERCNSEDFDYFALSVLLLRDPSQANKVGKAREKKTKNWDAIELENEYSRKSGYQDDQLQVIVEKSLDEGLMPC